MKRLFLSFTALLMITQATAAQQHADLATLSPGNLSQMLLGLGAVLALIAAAAWLLRRYPKLRGTEGAIRVVGGLPLSSRERLLLVEIEGTRLLIGVAPGQIQALHVCESKSADQNFATVLEAASTHE